MEPGRARSGQSSLRRAALAVACGLALAVVMDWPATTWAAAGATADLGASAGFADFDRSMLAGNGGNTADLSRFERGNPVLPGIYNLDVYLNNIWIGRMNVRFV